MTDSESTKREQYKFLWGIVAFGLVYWLGPAACMIALNPPGSHSRAIGHGDVSVSLLPNEDRIVFNGHGQGGHDLYLLDLEDDSIVRLTDTPEYEIAPAVSPDGKWIVYASGHRRDPADHLFRMRTDGTEKKQLTDSEGNDSAPSISPDGKSIVFVRETEYLWGGLASNWSNSGMICVTDSDGTDFRVLVPGDFGAFAPAFSADGQSIIYSVNGERFSVPMEDESVFTKLPGPSGAMPSPDEKWLVYSKGQYAPDHQVFLLNTETGEETCLTPGMGYCFKPHFTRSGDRVLFFHEVWPEGATGEPKRNLWEIPLEGDRQPKEVFGYEIFDEPMKATGKK